jgi:hypothetical protein
VKVSGRRGPVAHAANVFDVFVSWIKNMFGGLSKASNSRYTPGILCVDGQVHHDPPPLVEAQGSMLINREPGKVELAVGPVLTAPTGCGQIALSSNGDALTAYLPGGNDIVQTTGALKAGTGGLIGLDGGTLIGLDGSSLIGLDGSSLVAAGGGNVLSHNGGAFIAALGAGIAPVPSKMVAAGAGNMVAAGAGNMVAAGAGN